MARRKKKKQFYDFKKLMKTLNNESLVFIMHSRRPRTWQRVK